MVKDGKNFMKMTAIINRESLDELKHDMLMDPQLALRGIAVVVISFLTIAAVTININYKLLIILLLLLVCSMVSYLFWMLQFVRQYKKEECRYELTVEPDGIQIRNMKTNRIEYLKRSSINRIIKTKSYYTIRTKTNRIFPIKQEYFHNYKDEYGNVQDWLYEMVMLH